jgi:hypothetical protein
MLSSVVRSTTLATSVRLTQLQRAIVAVTGGGPSFPAAQEPVQDGVGYAANDGVTYYRPVLRVANRGPGRRPGPDVWFLEDDQGVITLQWTLEVMPLAGGPAGARPLPFTVDSVRMVWDAGQRDFEAPGVEPIDNPAEGQAAIRIHGAAQLRPDEAAQLEAAMNHHESACRLDVTLSYDYTVQVPTGDTPTLPPRHRIPRPTFPTSPGPRPTIPIADRIAFKPQHIDIARLRMSGQAADDPQVVAEAELSSSAVAATAFDPGILAGVSFRRITPDLRAELVGTRISDLLVRPTTTRPDARHQTITRSVPFVFEPNVEANGPIYRALHDAASLTDDWQQLGDVGWLRDSDFPNTVFRLPDALRLAWDTETAGPRMAPTLYRNDAGDPRVRLLLRLGPWQDPSKIVLARKGLDMPAVRVVTGQVGNAVLHMGGAFPEELTLVGGSGVAIPLGGVELAFDVSLSFYEFICQVVTRPEGLSGTVEVALGLKASVDGTAPADGGTAAQEQRTVVVPVSIRLDRVDDLPCTISVPDGMVSPTTVTVTNASGAEVSIGGCAVSFLQVDEESVVPVDIYPARCTSPFPITLPPGGHADLALELQTPAEDIVWNGVQVELLDKRLTATPVQVLHQVHELAPAGSSTRDLSVTSPVFSSGTLPERWKTLASIEVEVTTATGQVVTAVLSLANPTRTLHLPASLDDLVAGVGGGIPTVNYRVRNNYVDHQGEWTAVQSQSGEEIVVYPNAAETG